MSSPAKLSSIPPPAVDERLVASESRHEVEDGRIRYAAPADEPHGTQHSKLSALLEAHVGEDFEVASDMLTRTSERDDAAPDASVFPRARDPVTGGRQIEQLAFEVASTETLNHAGRKASKLVKRGVRRVFVIDIVRQRASEWVSELGAWRALEADTKIADPALAVPLPVNALVSAAKVDDAVAEALLAKQNRVLQAALRASRAGGRLEGETKGKVESLLTIISGRQLPLTREQRERIETESSTETLDRWLTRVAQCRSVSELLD